MQIKKYRALDMHEALQKVKDELGSDAIILSTRQVRGGSGRFGLFGKPMLEVTAARDAGSPEAVQAMAARTRGAPPPTEDSESDLLKHMLIKNRSETEGLLAPLQDEIGELKEVLQAVGNGQRLALREDTVITQLRAEMSDVKNLVQNLAIQSQGLKRADYPDNLVVMYQQLTFAGVEEKFVRRVIDESLKSIPGPHLEDFSYVKIFLARMLMKILKVTGGFVQPENRQKVVALVGPTGVGKTTTVAKLASEQVLKHHRKVGLITVDTFRIAAVEQLKVYAKIMGVPITVVQNRAELDLAIKNYHDVDVVFVDTGGRSQRDELQMSEIYKLFGESKNIDVFLTLSSTTKDSDLSEITRIFSEINLSGVIFTKLDESTAFGSLFNHAIRFKLPIAYLATGQKVPEDIEAATKERLVDLILNISGG